jgi:histone-lysine N-methyltransferase SETMAR
MACPDVNEEENCTALSWCSDSHVRHDLQAQWTKPDNPVPLGTTINDHYYCTALQDKVRRAVRLKQPELLQRGVILHQDIATHHRHRDVQNLLQHGAWEVLAHPPYPPDLAPCDYWLFASGEEHLRRKQFES